MSKIMRIPYTAPFPPALIYPSSATTINEAVTALHEFLLPPHHGDIVYKARTLILTGAGISVESGLADYRGENGTYRLNKRYKPTFYGEYISSHEARKRYWARSFMGWPTIENAKPNKAHMAIARLGTLKLTHGTITQNVDSLHHLAHPRFATSRNLSCRTVFDTDVGLSPLSPPVVEIHGTLRHITCLSCSTLYPRDQFQKKLQALNPAWAKFLYNSQRTGAFNPNTNPQERIRTNPDGDVDVPGAPYTKFRYPPCPKCLNEGGVEVEKDGAHIPNNSEVDPTTQKNAKGILKPSVVFFGENVQSDARDTAYQLIEDCQRILVIGSSLATYSAWKLVREVAKNGKGVGIINLGGVRGEAEFFETNGGPRLRLELPAADVLGGVVEAIEGRNIDWVVDDITLGSNVSGLGG